ncbi:serine hydrolase [Nocardioides sp. YIM 152588]|uniref:serine hydrolase domain-containing protein n=1 Tax=Nocardioides sp. YIM 152588 TaxID=3158259 RepID=UPI0032E40136
MISDPYATAEQLGLMRGFPPPPEKRVTRANALMTPPYNRWSYQHMRTIYPSAPVPSAERAAPLTVESDAGIPSLEVARAEGGVIDFDGYLRESYTDALVVVTPDRVVHASLLNGMGPRQPHQMMSATKSFAGLLGLMAVADGLVSESDPVTRHVPELAGATAFADATFGHVLDMVNSMAFDEDYADPASGIIRYGQALGWLESPAGGPPADSLYDFLATLEKDPTVEHGQVFHYQTPKTDVVNWITNRATGRSFQDALHDRLWSRLGTDGETYVLLDRNGTLVAGGGLNAGPWDLARFAMMLLNDGVAAGERVVAPAVIDTIAAGASREAFAAGPDATGPFAGGDWSYRAQWWVRHTPGREAFTAIGIHGQWIYVDRAHGVAIVKQSSQPVSLDLGLDALNLNAYDAIIDHLST